MISPEVIKKIEDMAAQVAEREGCRLYDIEFGGGGQGRTLRVLIDKADGYVGIEDCSNVSKGLNLLLDEVDPVPGGAYHLEVSSPGLEKNLKKPWHFETVVGQKIWVKLGRSLENLNVQSKVLKSAKQISEVLTQVTNEGLCFVIEGEQLTIPFSMVEKSKLIYDFDAEKGKKKK